MSPTRAIELQDHPDRNALKISDYPDPATEETRILLDRSSAEWALYCLMTGEHHRAQQHLARIRPRTLPQVLDAATRLADLANRLIHHHDPDRETEPPPTTAETPPPQEVAA